VLLVLLLAIGIGVSLIGCEADLGATEKPLS